ncbi:hypothetical protein OPV22_012710 [Ensete ventricosum]|uniref:Uncharacterized protein n=1 Tax=Ensete ventricosum TaxID=4639 RepID=A0AAV8PHC6_ENSVE|nr:hypothetical protein OPV22_012710 [Ensete ventricosum]
MWGQRTESSLTSLHPTCSHTLVVDQPPHGFNLVDTLPGPSRQVQPDGMGLRYYDRMGPRKTANSNSGIGKPCLQQTAECSPISIRIKYACFDARPKEFC